VWPPLAWQPSARNREQFLALRQVLAPLNTALKPHPACRGDDLLDFPALRQPLALATAAAGNRTALSLTMSGTGGGFPGLALSIALPQGPGTLVDSVGAKRKPYGAMGP